MDYNKQIKDWGEMCAKAEILRFTREVSEMLQAFDKLRHYCDKTGQCGIDVRNILEATEKEIQDLLPRIKHFKEKLKS